MTSAVSICNLALSRIGEDASITSLDPPEGSQHAFACSHFYFLALNTMLESHDWKFASARVSLARLDESLCEVAWRGAYAWPGNCLRIISIRPPGHDPRCYYAQGQYEIGMTTAGRTIFTNVRNPVAHYIQANVDPVQFSPSFTDALSWLLASYLAGEIIKGKEGAQMVQTFTQYYRMSYGQAQRMDANQQFRRRDFVPSWIARR